MLDGTVAYRNVENSGGVLTEISGMASARSGSVTRRAAVDIVGGRPAHACLVPQESAEAGRDDRQTVATDRSARH